MAVLQFLYGQPAAKKISRYVPLPFWVYFLPILLNSAGLMPTHSSAYSWLQSRVLPASLFLMLVGAPVAAVMKLGPKAVVAMALGAATMVCGVVLSFFAVGKFLPEEGWKMAGALLATWVGGSANMVAAKEILGLANDGMGVVIVADTFFSYAWMALLLCGVPMQRLFDKGVPASEEKAGGEPYFKDPPAIPKRSLLRDQYARSVVVLAGGYMAGAVMVAAGNFLAGLLPVLNNTAWIILLTSTVSVGLAFTSLRRIENYGASKMGVFLLYVILASMGAGTTLKMDQRFFAVFVFSLGTLLTHGALLLAAGKLFRIPLFLLATASQANVGGVVSAPIVAGVYRPGAAHLGVLMAILGAVAGTYIGVGGGYICAFILTFLSM